MSAWLPLLATALAADLFCSFYLGVTVRRQSHTITEQQQAIDRLRQVIEAQSQTIERLAP